MMTTVNRVEEFNESNGMWDGFAGASSWNRIAPPVFVSIGNWLIIADAEVTQCYCNEEDRCEEIWDLPIVFGNQKAAKEFLEIWACAANDKFEPADFGGTQLNG